MVTESAGVPWETDETAIATQNTSVATTVIDEEDLGTAPYIKLIQRQSLEMDAEDTDVAVGDYYAPDLGNLGATLEVVPLYYETHRQALTGVFGDEDRETLCYSTDGKTGRVMDDDTEATGNCATCPLASKYDEIRRTYECELQKRFTFFLPQQDEVVTLSLRDSNVRSRSSFAKRLLGTMYTMAKRNNWDTAFGRVSFILSSRTRKIGKNSWRAPMFSNRTVLDSETVEELESLIP